MCLQTTIEVSNKHTVPHQILKQQSVVVHTAANTHTDASTTTAVDRHRCNEVVKTRGIHELKNPLSCCFVFLSFCILSEKRNHLVSYSHPVGLMVRMHFGFENTSDVLLVFPLSQAPALATSDLNTPVVLTVVPIGCVNQSH